VLNKEGIIVKKLVILSTGIVSLAAAGLIALPSVTQAQGGNSNGGGYGYQQSLETKAKVLGMTTDKLQEQLKTKTMLQIAKDKGISEDQLHQKLQAAAQERWKTRGLSQEQINTRLKNMEERQASCDGTGNGGGMQAHGRNQ